MSNIYVSENAGFIWLTSAEGLKIDAVCGIPLNKSNLQLVLDVAKFLIAKRAETIEEVFYAEHLCQLTAGVVEVQENYNLYLLENNEEGKEYAKKIGVSIAKPGDGFILNEKICKVTDDNYLAHNNFLLGIVSSSPVDIMTL
jgi:hypothetical protein